MKCRTVLRFLISVMVIGSSANLMEATVYDLYYLGGQSNMDGYGRVEELPEELAGPVEGVMIFHGNTSADATAVDGRGVWAELLPGHGAGYTFDGESATYSDRFGVELTFAQTLKNIDPDAKIAIIKYSRGGTSIDRAGASYFGCWDPDFPGGKNSGINQYDHFLATIRNAMAVADPDPLRFQPEIDAFSRWDGKNSPPEDPLLFVGSSSIRYWSTATSFPACEIVNRGFGGAHISDVQYFYDDIVVGYRPKAIVFYAGDNDIGAGKSPNQVLDDYTAFVETVRRDLPDTPIFFLAIKPSGLRWHLWRSMEEANALIRNYSESNSDLVFVDVATPMLGEDGTPREELFVDDRLHLNEAGYKLWNSILGPDDGALLR